MALPAIGGSIVSFFTGGISAAHERAVKRENEVLGAAIPAANGRLQQIVASAEAGRLTGAELDSALDGVVASYYSEVGSIIKRAGAAASSVASAQDEGACSAIPKQAQCNAACVGGCKLEVQVRRLKLRLLPQTQGVKRVLAQAGSFLRTPTGLLALVVPGGLLLLGVYIFTRKGRS